jgi:threonine dehydratase
MLLPKLDDVYAARERIHKVVRPTPLMRHPLLCAETGLEIFVKHENHNPTGSFKVRGGLNLVSSLSAEERRGVLAATTGNHGQSIALACQREHVPCTIVVPTGNNPDKNAAMRAYGANLIEFGRDYDEARERVEQMHKETGLRYIHSANEPMLIAGVATYALEIFDELADADVILVPIGGGTGACGCAVVRSGLGRATKIIGVQTERADAFARSWHGGVRVVGNKADTFADGMATRVTFDLTFGILTTELDDVVTLSEDELAEGVRLAIRTTHNLAEGAGAASLMAAKKMRDALQGKKVVSVMTGGNIDTETLRKILQRPAPSV